MQDIRGEYLRAAAKFPRFNSAHEGYAVLLEEVRELERAVFWETPERQREEAVQVGAMAVRFLMDVCQPSPEPACKRCDHARREHRYIEGGWSKGRSECIRCYDGQREHIFECSECPGSDRFPCPGCRMPAAVPPPPETPEPAEGWEREEAATKVWAWPSAMWRSPDGVGVRVPLAVEATIRADEARRVRAMLPSSFEQVDEAISRAETERDAARAEAAALEESRRALVDRLDEAIAKWKAARAEAEEMRAAGEQFLRAADDYNYAQARYHTAWMGGEAPSGGPPLIARNRYQDARVEFRAALARQSPQEGGRRGGVTTAEGAGDWREVLYSHDRRERLSAWRRIVWDAMRLRAAGPTDYLIAEVVDDAAQAIARRASAEAEGRAREAERRLRIRREMTDEWQRRHDDQTRRAERAEAERDAARAALETLDDMVDCECVLVTTSPADDMICELHRIIRRARQSPQEGTEYEEREPYCGVCDAEGHSPSDCMPFEEEW